MGAFIDRAWRAVPRVAYHLAVVITLLIALTAQTSLFTSDLKQIIWTFEVLYLFCLPVVAILLLCAARGRVGFSRGAVLFMSVVLASGSVLALQIMQDSSLVGLEPTLFEALLQVGLGRDSQILTLAMWLGALPVQLFRLWTCA